MQLMMSFERECTFLYAVWYVRGHTMVEGGLR